MYILYTGKRWQKDKVNELTMSPPYEFAGEAMLEYEINKKTYYREIDTLEQLEDEYQPAMPESDR